MVKRSLNLLLMLLIGICVAFSQGRGGRQGNQQGRGQAQGGIQAGSGQMERRQVRLTTQQRDQIRTCDRLADGIRKQARAMGKSAGNKSSANPLPGQRDQIRSRIREMEKEHERLMNGLDAAQKQELQHRVQNMNQIREQVHVQLQQLDTEVDSANPGPKRVAERTREIERAMTQWRRQYDMLYAGSEF